MTWATVITLAVLGLGGIVNTVRKQEDDIGTILIGVWLLACAYSIWERYL